MSLKAKYADGRGLATANEAKTRLLLVDEILGGLGWARDEYAPESRTQSGNYLDYLLTLNDVPRLVVEAKRIGHTFGHPQTGLQKTEYKLSYMESAFRKPFTEALTQAKQYSAEVRVPYAVVTNGAQWVLLQALPLPGTRTQDLRCLYFGNILGDDADIALLWELLARPNVAQNALEERFAILNHPEEHYSVEPRTLLGDLRWILPSNDAYLRDFYDRFLDEIVDPSRRFMLQHCYVSNARLDQYEGALKRALQDTAPIYIEEAKEITPNELDGILPGHTGDRKGRVVLVTGSVGAGKTTFVTKVIIENRA